MADLNAICAALATQITAKTTLRASAQVKDQISPPMALVVPGNPLITFGETMDGAVTLNLAVLILLSDAPPTEAVQRALNAYLGIGSGEGQSIAGAIMTDPSLGRAGGTEWCIPTSVTSYSRIEWNSVIYFGARLNVSVGAV